MDDSDDKFLDAAQWSFGSSANVSLFSCSESIPAEPAPAAGRNVRFNSEVGIMGGGKIPIAAGDGWWDTLQYLNKPNRFCLKKEASTTSLDLADLGGGSNHSKDGSMSLTDLAQHSEASLSVNEATAKDGAEANVAGAFAMGPLMAFFSKAFNQSDDEDVPQDDLRRQAVEMVLSDTTKSQARLSTRDIAGATAPQNNAAATATLNTAAQ